MGKVKYTCIIFTCTLLNAVPTDNRLSRGSFNGRSRPELNKDFLSRLRLCSTANERGTAALRHSCYR